MRRSVSLCCVVMLFCFTSTAAQEDENKFTSRTKQARQWIQQLGAEVFAVREAATANLIKSGETAVKEVAMAATGSNVEVAGRALLILSELATCSEGESSRVAEKALVDLAFSKHRMAASMARTALVPMQLRITSALEASGAGVSTNEKGMIVAVRFEAAKALGENLRLLHELPDLETLSFSTPLMDDDGLSKLSGLQRLRDLNLYQSRVSDAGMKYLKTMPNLRSVPMGETRVTDKGLIHLKDLTQLEYVGLRANQVTDDGLVHLKKLTNLTGLYLGETKVTDAGLIHLRPLIKLNSLRLDHTRVSDAGLEHLMSLTELQSITLSDTKVTQTGFARLKKALPKLQGDLEQDHLR